MSIHRDKWEREAQREIDELLDKKVQYGWTQKDADRYNELSKELSK